MMKVYIVIRDFGDEGCNIMGVADSKEKAEHLVELFSDDACKATYEIHDTDEYSMDELPTYRMWFYENGDFNIKKAVYASCEHATTPIINELEYNGKSVWAVTVQADTKENAEIIGRRAFLKDRIKKIREVFMDIVLNETKGSVFGVVTNIMEGYDKAIETLVNNYEFCMK